MKFASIAEVKARFNAYLRESQVAPVVVTRDGKPVAVLFAVQDEADLERLMLAHSPRLREVLDRGRSQIEAGEGIGHAEFWGELAEEPDGEV